MMDFITYVYENFGMILSVATSVVGIFALIATKTANKSDDKVVQILLNIINILGANFGQAKNDSSKTSPNSSGTSKLVCFLFLALFLLPGCAIHQIADSPPVDITASASMELMKTYESVWNKYIEIKPTIPAEYENTRRDFVNYMNLAKPAISAVGLAASAWKASKTLADSQKAEQVYLERKKVAQEIFNKALDCWARIKGGDK